MQTNLSEASRHDSPLSPAMLASYREMGYSSPFRALSDIEARALRSRLEAFEQYEGKALSGPFRHKTHLLFTWLSDLVRHPVLLDVVENLLGRDLLVWSSSFFIKEANDPGFVSWHQDSTYWGLSEPEVVTAWVAFTPSNRENGCMRVIPRTHRVDQVAHRDTFAENNLLTRGQEIAVEVDEKQALDIVLDPGEFSLHHVRLFHSSDPNRSADRRIGFAIRYIPTHLRQVVGERDSATLVRGQDRYGNFDLEPAPTQDLSPAALALHEQITERNARVLYRGTHKNAY